MSCRNLEAVVMGTEEWQVSPDKCPRARIFRALSFIYLFFNSNEGASLPAVSISCGGCLGLFKQPPSSGTYLAYGMTDFWPVCATKSWQGDFDQVLLWWLCRYWGCFQRGWTSCSPMLQYGPLVQCHSWQESLFWFPWFFISLLHTGTERYACGLDWPLFSIVAYMLPYLHQKPTFCSCFWCFKFCS